ncbi:MAG: triose-phosphate isomerase [Candidatus Woesearchaeota archaeon]|nr:triose-phosphate isomerase [Candidatus Woesearchaeota archaeon]
MRKPIIAGNWKMNKVNSESVAFARELRLRLIDVKDVEIVVCPPFTALHDAAKEIRNSNIKLGAQNMHFEDSGAFTGEVSPLMLKELGVKYVILGHSERRQYFNETDDLINKKIKKALQHNIIPILCVGEKLEEREKGETKKIVEDQIKNCLKDIDASKIVIAYEPVWAIGTGKNATPEQAEEVHLFIRELVKSLYDEKIANNIRIQYGGSVKPDNIKALMDQKDIDGALVGGASLKVDDFVKIVKYRQ